MHIFDLVKLFETYSPGNHCGTKPNQIVKESVDYAFNESDMDKWNHLYTTLLESDLNQIIRTRSGGISTSFSNWNNNCYSWDLRTNNSGGSLTAIVSGRIWVFRIGHFKDNNKSIGITPQVAFSKFKDLLKKDGVDLDQYANEAYQVYNEDEIKHIKNDIFPEYLIKCDESIIDETLHDVHHLDFHSSFPAGLANTHPEFANVIRNCYDKRKGDDRIYKSILNVSIGFMQSKHVKYKFMDLSADAINDNNRRLLEIAERLKKSGRKIISFNTDGIWYQGDIYHGKGEGEGLGNWRNDHINCTYRQKSPGVYEFTEDNNYYPVFRGVSSFEKYVSKENWKWGDIYKGNELLVKFNLESGYYFEEDKKI